MTVSLGCMAHTSLSPRGTSSHLAFSIRAGAQVQGQRPIHLCFALPHTPFPCDAAARRRTPRGSEMVSDRRRKSRVSSTLGFLEFRASGNFGGAKNDIFIFTNLQLNWRTPTEPRTLSPVKKKKKKEEEEDHRGIWLAPSVELVSLDLGCCKFEPRVGCRDYLKK